MEGACKNLGPCNMGCPQGAKSSADITYWPKAIKNGVELRTRCRVREIEVDKNDKVKGVIFMMMMERNHLFVQTL